MSPKYTLRYFDIKARGETARLLFALANQEYEDVRFTFEEWPAMKPNFPMGKCPVLEVDGRELSQSMAIARYLAREFKLVGECSWENAICDMFCEINSDVTTAFVKHHFAPESATEEKAKFKEEAKKAAIGCAEIIKSKKKGKFILGSQVDNMAPKYTLRYFDGRGRAETARLVFALAGKEYEDVRFSMEEWKHLRPSFPMGQCPVLEVDGKQLAQSMTIARYLAREFGLAGSCSWENAVCDMFCDINSDLLMACGKIIFVAKTEEEKATMKEEAKKLTSGCAKMLKERRKGKFICGDKLTVADLAMFAAIEFMDEIVPDASKCCPVFGELREAVSCEPAIAAYLKTRKVTPW